MKLLAIIGVILGIAAAGPTPAAARRTAPQTEQEADDAQGSERGDADVAEHGSDDANSVENDEAGEDPLALMELDLPVVVTAGRHEQPLGAVAHAVSVITREDIRRSGARNLGDALRLAPGVDVAELSSGASAISPRAFHAFVNREVLVLVDGRQLFDSFFGGTLWHHWPISLEDVERIEVIRGPAGVTWGANAMCGVINIITKTPSSEPGTRFMLGGGSRGWNREHVSHARRDEGLRWRLSLEHESHDGFVHGGSFAGSLDDDYRAGRMHLNAITDLKTEGESFSLQAGSALVDGGFPATPLRGLSAKRNPGSQASFVLGRWSGHPAPGDHWDLTLYVNDFQASPGVNTVDYRYQQFAAQWGQTTVVNAEHTVTWGVDSRTDLLDTSNSDPMLTTKDFMSSAIIGAYLEDKWRFAPSWMLSLGGRVDYEFYGGFQPSGRAALSYELNENSLVYASVSRAFQMPSVGLRFMDFPLFGGLSRVKGDRDLDIESVVAYELGYRSHLTERLEMNVTPFWHHVYDITTLQPQLAPPTLLRMDVDNRADATLYGVEWDARYRATDRLTLLSNYTYQEFAWDSGDSTLYQKDIASPPKHKAMIGARYDLAEDWRLSGHLYWVDATKAWDPRLFILPVSIAPYFRLDVLVETDLRKDRATLSFGVKNLLDAGHLEGTSAFIDAGETPRLIFAELRLAIP